MEIILVTVVDIDGTLSQCWAYYSDANGIITSGPNAGKYITRVAEEKFKSLIKESNLTDEELENCLDDGFYQSQTEGRTIYIHWPVLGNYC